MPEPGAATDHPARLPLMVVWRTLTILGSTVRVLGETSREVEVKLVEVVEVVEHGGSVFVQAPQTFRLRCFGECYWCCYLLQGLLEGYSYSVCVVGGEQPAAADAGRDLVGGQRVRLGSARC